MLRSLAVLATIAGCAVDSSGAITLENSAGKADGSADQLVELAPDAELRFTCDEGFLDRCNIVLVVTPDFPLRDAARDYLRSLGTEGQVDLVGIHVLGPRGDAVPLLWVTTAGDFVRDTIVARIAWVGRDRDQLVPSEEDELELASWAKGEYRIRLDPTLPATIHAPRRFYVSVRWE